MFSTQQYSGFDPRSIPGCALWLDAADSRTLTVSANLVSDWTNKGLAGGSFAIGAGSGAEPTLTTSSNLPSIFFDGVNDRLNGSFAMANYVDPAAHTSFVVAMPTVVNTDSATTFSNDTIFGDTAGGYGIYLRSSGLIGAWVFDGTSKSVTTSYTPSNRVLVSSQHDSSNISLRLNGNNAVSTAAGSNTSLGFSRIGISASGVQQFYEGHVFEIITFTNSLSSSQRQQVEGYLMWKWNLQSNIPTGHPFKSIPVATRVFQPIDISGCNLWLDGADKSTFTPANPADGTGITAWSDKSGSNFTFSRTLGAADATYNAASNSLFFSTSNAGYSSSHPASVNNETLFTVFTSTFNGGAYIVGATGSGGREVGTYVNWTRFGIINATTEWAAITPNASMTGGARNLGVFTVSSSSNTAVAVNGGTFTTYTLANPLGSNARTSTLGVEGTTPTYSGHIHEVLTYNRVLSGSERQQVEGYLATKWGISGLLPSTQPYYLYRNLPTTPLFVPGGASLWLDATDITTFTFSSGSNISQWRDKSGNGLVGSASFGATYTPAAHNNLAAVSFASASNQRIDFGDTLKLNGNRLYMFAVAKINTSDGTIISRGNTIAGGYSLFRESSILYTAVVPSSYVQRTASTADSTTNTQLLSGTWDRTTLRLFRNATNVASTGAADATSLSDASALWIGGFPGIGAFLQGQIMEVVVYISSIDTSQQQRIEGYLAWKWGLQNNLPTTHPYYKFRP